MENTPSGMLSNLSSLAKSCLISLTYDLLRLINGLRWKSKYSDVCSAIRNDLTPLSTTKTLVDHR